MSENISRKVEGDPGRCSEAQREEIASIMKEAIPENFRREQAEEILRNRAGLSKSVLAVLREGGELPKPFRSSGW